jgi:peptide/nickel transport system substrate-binding protein
VIACTDGPPAPRAAQPAADAAAPPASSAATPEAPASQTTAVPTSTPAPWDAVTAPGWAAAGVSGARDSIVLVTEAEPHQLGAFSPGCLGDAASLVCEDAASDPLTWIDSATYEVVPLSGVERWEQAGPDRWRFYLRDGVTFHNGEPWNAAAARLGVEIHGDRDSWGHGTGSYGLHGALQAEVVDDLTLDIVCEFSCPILPRTTTFLKFQAPAWWAASDAQTRESTTVGLGPYRIVEWRQGVEVELERFPDYRPNTAFDAQAPIIERVFQVWNPEEVVRAAMVAAGKADLAFDIGLPNLNLAPRALLGPTNEVYFLAADSIWHPELRKKQVREALNLAIDCDALMDAVYYGLQQCWGNISPEGTTGLNGQNAAPYHYDPQRARQLLQAAGYNPANEVIIHTRQGRVFRDVELWQAVAGMWQDVGVNARVQVMEPDSHRELLRSGCGSFGVNAGQCAQMDPPGLARASGHLYEIATANQSLDLQQQLMLRTSCFSPASRVCNQTPGLEDAINDAVAAPLGPQRTSRLEALAQTIRDESWFIPLFQVQTAYGLAPGLEWVPRHDARTRLNTMRFAP